MGARSDSTIKVNIIGDASKLGRALGKAEGDTGKLAGNLLKLGAGIGIAKLGFDFLGDSLDESDRLGDSITRLQIQVGDLSGPLVDAAGGFARLGASKQDILELEAAFADTATALGIADPLIASFADDVAATAAAAALLGDTDALTITDQIGKAAGGSEKAMKALGVSFTDAEVTARALADTGKTTAAELTGSELAAARLALILDQLKPKLDAATTGSRDLEGSQKELQARVKTLQAELGDKLAPALVAVLGFLIDEIDAIPGAVEGWRMLGEAVVGFARDALGPLARVNDVLSAIERGLRETAWNLGHIGSGEPASGTERDQQRGLRNWEERNGLSSSTGPRP